MYGVEHRTFYLNKVERIDGGFKVLMYTDKNEFNPMWKEGATTPGRGEIWLTFKYDDAQLSKGFLTLSNIRQGYHFQFQDIWDRHQAWRDTSVLHFNAQESMYGAKWWTADRNAPNAPLAGKQFGEKVLEHLKG